MGELPEEHLGHLTDRARQRVATGPGPEGDIILCHFVMLMFGKLIFVMRADGVSCKLLPLLRELDGVGDYALGAATLVFLFDSLNTTDY